MSDVTKPVGTKVFRSSLSVRGKSSHKKGPIALFQEREEMSDVGFHISDVRCQISNVRCLASDVRCQMSEV